MPKAVIPEPPIALLIDKFPDIIVVTENDANYWAQACESYQAIAGDELDELQQVQQDFPGLTQNTACNWAIYGWPVQNELTVENHMLRIAQYVKELNAQSQLLVKMTKHPFKTYIGRIKGDGFIPGPCLTLCGPSSFL